MALTLIPEPVLGAVGLYAAGFLMVSGMELVASRAMDSRAIFAVGLSLSAGLALLQLPQLAQHVPQSLHFLVGDGFVVAGILVIVLNLVLRIGTGQRAMQPCRPAAPSCTPALPVLSRHGAPPGGTPHVVQRAALAALEAAEAIAASAGGPRQVTIRGSFDEFSLGLELLHGGAPLPLPAGTPGTRMRPACWTATTAPSTRRWRRCRPAAAPPGRPLSASTGSGADAGQSVLRLHFEH